MPSVELHARLHTPAVALATSGYVRLFVDITNEDEDDPIQRRFGLITAPMLLVIAPDGTVTRCNYNSEMFARKNSTISACTP